MEENITQRKTNSINIIVYGQVPNIKTLESQVQAFVNPEGKDTREIKLTPGTSTSSANSNTNSHEIHLLADTGDENTAQLRKALDSKGKAYLCITGNDIFEAVKTIISDLETALDLGFTADDFVRMHSRGTSIEKVRQQLIIFRNGVSKIRLKKPATLNNGIFQLPEEAAMRYANYFDSKKDSLELVKFVPASGAASRMFKFLCEFVSEFDAEKETINAYINRKNDNALKVFLVGIDKFPFFEEVLRAVKENPEYAEWRKDLRYWNFIKNMLTGQFDYANKPKGILPFHKYDNFKATPVYEHLKEAVAYAGAQNQSHVHFTISESHLDGFMDCIEDVKENIEKESGVAISYSFSYQHQATDTLAVDMNNTPFRTAEGKLLFRPGGHGALIENLGRLDADIVFVKNIDNVSHNNLEVITLYKKALAGMLIELREKIFGYLDKIERNALAEEEICGLFDFAKEKLMIDVSEDIRKYTLGNKLAYAKELLDRPIRVCGMVKNEGEPGGGPFWVKEENGRLSLQIVESSQIDLEDKAQNEIFSASTHFNPVDLVCGLKDHKGEPFDLGRFVDNSAGFIVYKNKMGKDLKSYELPGLWNGAMAGWITVFAEVPLATFNPVKTVNDLLKPAHQPQ